MQIPSALFGQYRSAKWLIFGGLIGWSVATLFCGLSPSLPALIAFRVLVGIAEGTAVPTLLILIRRWFPLQERGWPPRRSSSPAASGTWSAAWSPAH